MFLENMGLAKKIDSVTWKVDPEHMGHLKELQLGKSKGLRLSLGRPE